MSRARWRAVFGDRRGLFVCLLAALVATIGWRTIVTINDNYTVLNGLVALAEGHVVVQEAVFGPSLQTPGMVHGQAGPVARNYAHIVLSLPALGLLQAIDAVADLTIALVGGWSLLLLATVVVAGDILERGRLARLAGSGFALVTFVVGVALATPLDQPHLALLAMQTTTVAIAALSATLLYRLVAHLHDDRVGLAAGVALAVASPSVLWATIPKRHVLTAAFALATCYWLARSRATGSSARRFHALAYVPVGLTAWLNAAEGLVLLAALIIVDIVTIPDFDRRRLALVAGAFACSLLPLVVTNLFVAGDPLTTPRMLPPYGSGGGGDIRFVADGGGSSGGGGTGGGGTGAGSSGGGGGGTGSGGTGGGGFTLAPLLAPLIASFTESLSRLGVFVGFLTDGAQAVVTTPSNLYHAFLRSGYVATEGAGATGLAINLAFLEALPIAGALAALPVLAARRLRGFDWSGVRDSLATPARTADMFVLSYGLLLTLIYIHRLPLHAMLTVRYVYPLFPLALYAVARLPAARAIIRERATLLAFVYTGGVAIGGQLTVLVVALAGYTASETLQAYALIALGLATLLAGWSVAAALDRRLGRTGAVLFGLAGACATNVVGVFLFHFFGKAFLLPFIPL
ncbi:hypothetical protein [Halosegnis longus]|uniref:hypothetical protein n=1 Tax=Halosegnis longus TaxID=2216012 RepID=UPI001313F254